MNKYLTYIAIAISVIALAIVLVSNSQSSNVGASGSRFPSGISADSTSPSAGQVRGTTGTFTGAFSAGATTMGATTMGVLTQGGLIRATSSPGSAETLLSSDMETYSIIDYTPTVQSLTLTLPATTTFPSIATPGQMRSWVIRNATTSSVNITITAGTGIDLQEPNGGDVVIGTTNYAWLTCYRKADTDIVCLANESIPAD